MDARGDAAMRRRAADRLERMARVLLRTASMSERPSRYRLRVWALDWMAGRLRNVADLLVPPPEAGESEWHA